MNFLWYDGCAHAKTTKCCPSVLVLTFSWEWKVYCDKMCYLYLMTGWRVRRQKKSKMIGPITLFTLLFIQCASSSFVANVTAERTLIFKGNRHKKSRYVSISRLIPSFSVPSLNTSIHLWVPTIFNFTVFSTSFHCFLWQLHWGYLSFWSIWCRRWMLLLLS